MPPLAANWNAPVALVSAALGRPAAVVGTTVPINLVAPGQVWGDRVNALDLRFAKILRFGRTRNTIGIDLYNVTNSARDPDLQPDLQPGDDDRIAGVDGAVVGVDAAVPEDRRADRFLIESPGIIGGAWEPARQKRRTEFR